MKPIKHLIICALLLLSLSLTACSVDAAGFDQVELDLENQQIILHKADGTSETSPAISGTASQDEDDTTAMHDITNIVVNLIILGLAGATVCIVLSAIRKKERGLDDSDPKRLADDEDNDDDDSETTHPLEGFLDVLDDQLENPNQICCWYVLNAATGRWCYQGTCLGYGMAAAVFKNGEPDWGYIPYRAAGPGPRYIMTIQDTRETPVPVYVDANVLVSPRKLPASACESWSLPEDY